MTEAFDRLCKEITQMGYKIRREDVPISCGIVMQLCDIEAYVRQLYPMAPEEVYGRIEEYASDLDQVNISVREAMGLIHDAGGKTVWAHPFCTSQRFHKIRMSREEILDALPQMKERVWTVLKRIIWILLRKSAAGCVMLLPGTD